MKKAFLIYNAVAVLLVALKVTGVISASWWLVTAPLWGPFIVVFVVVVLVTWLISRYG